MGGRSPSSSPRKSASLSKLPQRKRRRLNIDKGVKHDQQTYILKLYDRSVDLAQFSRTRLSILFAGLGLKTNRTTSVLQQILRPKMKRKQSMLRKKLSSKLKIKKKKSNHCLCLSTCRLITTVN